MKFCSELFEKFITNQEIQTKIDLDATQTINKQRHILAGCSTQTHWTTTLSGRDEAGVVLVEIP